MSEVSRILQQIEDGVPAGSVELLPLVYDELRKLAAAKLASEKPGQTLQATALVNEAYLRLVGDGDDREWNSRGHFFGAAAQAMRRILVDRARHKATLKAGGDHRKIGLSTVEPELTARPIDLAALDEALNQFEQHDPRACQVVHLRLFTGLTIPQTAKSLRFTTRKSKRNWWFSSSQNDQVSFVIS